MGGGVIHPSTKLILNFGSLNLKRGDLVYEAPYDDDKGIVVKILKGGSVKILCPNGRVEKFSKEYADSLVVVNEKR